MRVLHVASWFPANEADFSGVFVREHLCCLTPHVEQAVVIASPNGDDRESKEHGIVTHRTRLRHTRGQWLVPYVSAVVRFAKQFRPDLVHAHVTRPAGVAARAVATTQHIPYVITEHTNPFRALFATHVANRAAFRWALRGASTVTTVSQGHAEEIRVILPDLEARVIPNTVDIGRFRPRSRRDGPARLLFIGRLDRLKGCHLLLEALGHPELLRMAWTLRIVGAGDEETSLRTAAAALGERAQLLGYQEPARMADLLAETDLLVLPSFRESFGVVLIEALASGVPVLATRCGGPTDIVTDTVGRLVPPGDVPGLVEGLAWMIVHHHRFEPAALRREVDSRFGFAAVASQFLQVYREALGTRA